jgi:hypothetical protein
MGRGRGRFETGLPDSVLIPLVRVRVQQETVARHALYLHGGRPRAARERSSASSTLEVECRMVSEGASRMLGPEVRGNIMAKQRFVAWPTEQPFAHG